MRTRTVLAVLALLAVAAPAARAAPPSDPQAAAQEPLRIMRVGEALDLAARPLSDVRVLVADTGLDLDHPDLASRLFSLPAAVAAPNPDGLNPAPTVPAGSPGWDLLGTDAPGPLKPDADPSDPAGGSGHGTAVAGVLGAAHNNGQGGAGVAPNARFVVLRTCWDGDNCYQYIQDDAFRWAAERGVRIISLSWLSGALENDLKAAITELPNVLFVTIPSGNGGAYDADGGDPQPCNLNVPNVLCVSTSAPNDGLDCGAYGPTSVDLAVPTRNSVTTLNGGGFGPTACATSYASPTAAGIAAILLGIDPTATAADVRAAIVDSARKAPAWAGKSVSGGIADAAAAVALFQQRRGIAKPPPPPPPPPAADTTAPLLTAIRSGGQLVMTLSEPAIVQLTLERARRGRRVRGRCRIGARRGPRCTRHSQVSSRPLAASAGTSRIALPTRVGGRRLARGTYRVSLRARDAAGNRSKIVRVGYTIR